MKPTVAGVLSILRSAAETATVKRFVLTSSSTAVLFPQHEKEITVDRSVWNQEALELAWAPPPYTEDRAFSVYGASKTEAEKALWKFMLDEQPNFVANAILPNYNMGSSRPYRYRVVTKFKPQYLTVSSQAPFSARRGLQDQV